MFAAQGKRQLSSYRNGEIKTLLADLLGQEEIRDIGRKAAETARLLKAGLGAMRQEQAGLAEEIAGVEAAKRRIEDAASRVGASQTAKRRAQAAVDAALEHHTRLRTAREAARSVEERRMQLRAERRSELEATGHAVAALRAQDVAEGQRLQRLEQRVAARVQQEQARRQSLAKSRRHCLDVLDEAAAVARVVRRLELAHRVLQRRQVHTQACRERVRLLAQCQAAVRLAEQQLAGIERDAGKAVLRAQELSHRFGLTAEVPCAGTDLQGSCKLLGDAREAQALLPDASALVARCALEKKQVQRVRDETNRQREALADAPRALAWAEHRESAARERSARLTVLASKQPACRQASEMLSEIERELAALGIASNTAVPTAEEQVECAQIQATRQAIADQLERQQQRSGAAVARLDRLLAGLPPAYDESAFAAAGQAVAHARQALGAAEQSLLVAVRDAQVLSDLAKRSDALAARRGKHLSRCKAVEEALANWTLFARCMSNDGLIALAIDDAGPALSGLANDLLLACYGPRFTVSIHTLLETSKGEQKEGFDIVVHDGSTGESKSVVLMSGGERTWVEACLTRAIALYLAMHTKRRYTTLFTDEADGALDPERKRMFMGMKREVLRLGGYEREYYVSQTPELTAMADAVIDLDALKVDAVEQWQSAA